MAIQDDFSVSATGDIRYTGTTANYTVIELHRFLQDLADDAVAGGDDLLDITGAIPSDRSTDNIITLINGFNIDDAAAEHLYDGSITQAGGDTIYAGLLVVGSAPAGTQLQVIQNNTVLPSYWGTGLNADAANNILLRIMVKTRDAGADIDGQRLRVQARELGDTYGEFLLTMGLGNNTAAIFTSVDLNNQTAGGTIAGWPISNTTEGYVGLDVDGDGGNEFYFSQWALGGQSINDLYEFTKHAQRRGSVSTLYGLSGELFRGITHEIDTTGAAGTFSDVEGLTWAGGTGQLLAIDSTTAPTKAYMQLLTGTVPGDTVTVTGQTSSATFNVSGTPTARTVSSSFIGSSTGSSIIGAFGVGIDPAGLGASDQLFDLTNTLRNPPNNVQFTVSGLVSGEDRVLVGPEDGSGGLDLDQLATNVTLNSAGVTSVTVSTAIPTDTPTSGTIRVRADSGAYLRVPYSSFGGSTFTIPAFDFSGANQSTSGADCFISYVDTLAGGASESFTVVFASPRTLFVRVRDGGASPIKTFEATASIGAGGGSISAIRTTDQ